MPSFSVVITEAGPRPITLTHQFDSYDDAINFVSTKTTIMRTIIYDEDGNVVEYIHPNGTRLDPKSLIGK